MNEKKNQVKCETSYIGGIRELEFKIFDKQGRTRSKIVFDEENLIALRNIIDKCLNYKER